MAKRLQDKRIEDEAEFRGYVIAKLEALSEFKDDFKAHMDEEMSNLEKVYQRLAAIENWKTKVVAIVSVVAFLVNILADKVLAKIL